MSFYNMIHGENPHAGLLLATIGARRESFPRYRDCFLNGNGSEVWVLTRVGGGNRPDYQEFWRSLEKAELYLRDWNDTFDSTFAWIAFRVAEPLREAVRALATGEDPPDLGKRMEEFKRLVAGGTPLEKAVANPAALERLIKTLESGKGGLIKL